MSRRSNAYKANLLVNKAHRSGKRQYHVAHAVVHPAHSAVAHVRPKSNAVQMLHMKQQLQHAQQLIVV